MNATLKQSESPLPTSSTPPDRAASSRSRRVALVVACAVLALTIAAMWVQIALPSDGAFLLIGRNSWPAQGAPVAPLVSSSPGPLRRGDIVVAVDGRSLDSWTHAVFDPRAPHPTLRIGQRLLYTILRDGHRQNVVVTLRSYPFTQTLRGAWGITAFVLTFALVALFIFVRRPGERLSAPLLVAASAICCVVLGSFSLGVTNILGGSTYWLFVTTSMLADSLFLAALLHTVLLFPQPNPLIARWPRLIPAVYVAPFLATALALSVTRLFASTAVAWISTWQPVQRGISLVVEALVAAIIVWTYRQSHNEVTRQKIRWVVFGGSVALIGTLLLWFIPLFVVGHVLSDVNVLGVVQLAFPICLAIAILRHHLFDIDTLINRAMVYGSLTATLAALYFVCVLSMDALARAVTGQSQPHPVVIVASTLVIAALIQPLRRRIQAVIDRRFYRRKYDVARTLEAFGATLRHETDLPSLHDQLVGIIDDTMQPSFVSLWLIPRAHAGARPLAPATEASPPHPLPIQQLQQQPAAVAVPSSTES